MRNQVEKNQKISHLRRGLVTSLIAAIPLAAVFPLAVAAKQAAPKTGNALPEGPATKTIATPGPAASKAACSTSDKGCCYVSEIQGDPCCPNLKTGPTRANMTAAQFRAMQIKHGDAR